MSKHTPGPWRAVPQTNGSKLIAADLKPLGLRIIAFNVARADSIIEDDANAARIVACVNACEGIADPNVIPEMLAAIKRISYGLTLPADDVQKSIRTVLDPLIARAEGKP